MTTAAIRLDPHATFEAEVPVLIVGAGACGAMAALAARAAGAEALMLERDPLPAGSTALSSGFIPAAGTRVQQRQQVTDSPRQFAADIQAKAKGRADPVLVEAYTKAIAPALDWLAESHGIGFELLDGFLYPGHTARRMHSVAERTGEALLARLHRAARDAGAELLCDAHVTTLIVDQDRRVRGVEIARPDGGRERIGCRALVLACNGYGGNPARVRQYLPEMLPAEYFGHAGNQGDALAWGEALGAATADLTGYQGHGSVATPQRILITWALMMQGAIQVNQAGDRFANELTGYSEAAVHVLAQPGGVAFNIFDERLHELGLTFPDYQQALQAGAVRRAGNATELAQHLGIDAAGLSATLAHLNALALAGDADDYGRRFTLTEALLPPYFGVKVTGALFHTQGGLVVDADCRVLDAQHTPLPNLFAAGGAARGVSGDAVWGYLSGNGLLSAVAGGFIAGRAAAGA